jgi:hypothetical protein
MLNKKVIKEKFQKRFKKLVSLVINEVFGSSIEEVINIKEGSIPENEDN